MGLGSEIRDPEKTYSGSRIQGSKRPRIPDPDPQHRFEVLDVHFLELKASSLTWTFFMEAYGKVKCSFWSPQKNFFGCNFFLNFWSLKPWIRIGSRSGSVFSLKCWIRIRMKWMRIRNPDFNQHCFICRPSDSSCPLECWDWTQDCCDFGIDRHKL